MMFREDSLPRMLALGICPGTKLLTHLERLPDIAD
jgi:hypothetical protein